MYEVMWDVSKFADKSLWPTDGSDPFVYSMNIGGSAAHGDYVFGWEGDSLQKAMDNSCNLNAACPKAGLTVQTPKEYGACKKKQQAPEEVNGCKCECGVRGLRVSANECVQGLRRCRLVRKRSRLRGSARMVRAGLDWSFVGEVVGVVYCRSLRSVWILDNDSSVSYPDCHLKLGSYLLLDGSIQHRLISKLLAGRPAPCKVVISLRWLHARKP
jgi:hypothetical protein